MIRHFTCLLLLAATGPFLTASRASLVDVRGVHTDIRVSWDNDSESLALHWKTTSLYEPADAFASILPEQTFARPSGAQWDFMGLAAGETYWRAYRNQEPDYLYLGFDVQLPSDATFSLLNVAGPGAVSVWGTSSSIYWASHTAPANHSFVLTSGEHMHANWGFTQQGVYILTIGVEAVINGITESTQADFRFEIGAIPEPASAASLLGLCAVAFALIRRAPRPSLS